MTIDFIDRIGVFGIGAPFFAIGVILIYYSILRAIHKLKRWCGKRSGFCPSASALGMALLFTQVFYRPSLTHGVTVQQEYPQNDEQGDPETIGKTLDQQLRRIRQGESIEKLIL